MTDSSYQKSKDNRYSNKLKINWSSSITNVVLTKQVMKILRDGFKVSSKSLICIQLFFVNGTSLKVQTT